MGMLTIGITKHYVCLLLQSQLTSASWQRVSLVLLNWQLSHCGSSHMAPVSYAPPHLRVPLNSWISGSLTPHGQGTEATWPISVSGHVTGPALPQVDIGSSGQPSAIYIVGSSSSCTGHYHHSTYIQSQIPLHYSKSTMYKIYRQFNRQSPSLHQYVYDIPRRSVATIANEICSLMSVTSANICSRG